MVINDLRLYFRNKTAIPILYSVFLCLSVILINPLGSIKSEIWTEPKLFAIQLIVILNLWVVLSYIQRNSLVIPTAWKVGFALWLLFLSVGAISTILSPFPLRSFWGQINLGDGLFYWCFVAAFVMSNAIVLYLKPELIRYQLYGLLAGGVILALAIFIQVYDWRIDFTATSGQISELRPEMLKSKIWQGQMPIGFYTNRGEVALSLAVEGVLALLGLVWGWISAPIAGIAYGLICTALFYTKCRGALLGLLLALSHFLVLFRSDSNKRVKIICYGFGLLILSYFIFRASALVLSPDFTSRASPRNFKFNLYNLDSSIGRLQHWKLALKGIAKRPFFGWGFDGFSIAFPFIADWTGQHRRYLFDQVNVSEILSMKTYTFKYIGTDNMVHVGLIMVAKVHNFILDTVLSVGIIGLLSYLSLFAYFIWCSFNSTLRGIEASAIAYLVYTMTWYESGQFSHLGWWGLSVGLGCTKLLRGKKKQTD